MSVVLILAIALLVWLVGSFILRQLGVGRKYFCKIGWHSPASQWKSTGFDGCSAHVECPWCKYNGMVDSQGNLF